MNIKEKLKENWASFLVVTLDAQVLFLTISAIILLIISQQQQPNQTIVTIFTIIISIATGLVGGRIAERMSKLQEGGTLKTRGESAIRNLELLLRNVALLESRVDIYLNRLDSSNEKYEILRNNYEEIRERCVILQTEALNSIQDWSDIVPGVGNTSEISLFSELKVKERKLIREGSDLTERLAHTKEESKEKREALEQRLRHTEDELSQTKARLERAQTQINTSPILRDISGGTIGASTGMYPFSSTPSIDWDVKPFDLGPFKTINPSATQEK